MYPLVFCITLTESSFIAPALASPESAALLSSDCLLSLSSPKVVTFNALSILFKDLVKLLTKPLVLFSNLSIDNCFIAALVLRVV